MPGFIFTTDGKYACAGIRNRRRRKNMCGVCDHALLTVLLAIFLNTLILVLKR